MYSTSKKKRASQVSAEFESCTPCTWRQYIAMWRSTVNLMKTLDVFQTVLTDKADILEQMTHTIDTMYKQNKKICKCAIN